MNQQETTSIAEATLNAIKHLGTDVLFGVPGGHISPFLGVLRRQPELRYIIASHEGGAAFMADGYARASGKVGVCLVTAGPGATNAVTGIAAAHLDGTPLLVITGQTSTPQWGLGCMQESTAEANLDVRSMLDHVTRYSTCAVDASAYARLFNRALSYIRRPPHGVAHIAIPANIARMQIPALRLVDCGAPRHSISRATAQEVLTRLTRARRPLLFLGSGARVAAESLGDDLVRWAECHGIAVACSLRAKGVFPEQSPTSLGVFGIAGSRHAERYVQEGIDFLLVIGSRLGEWSSDNFSPQLHAEFTVQVDLEPTSMGRIITPDLPILCDSWSFLRTLVDESGSFSHFESDASTFRLQAIQALKTSVSGTCDPDKARSDVSPMKPQRIMAELNARLDQDGETDLYIDMGNCTGWATHCLQIKPPTRFFVPTGLSTMGWTCGAVLGGRLARPERHAIALLGDGAFLMNGTEIATGVRYRIGSVYIVLNDGYLGMVNHGEHVQTRHPLDDGYYALGSPDLASFARSLGAVAYEASSPLEFKRSLELALSAADSLHIPQVIVAKIDPAEVPPYGRRFRAVGGQ